MLLTTDVVPVVHELLSPGTATILVGGGVTLLTTLIAGIITIIKALRQNTQLLAATGEAGRTRGVVRDTEIKKIHLLVNSRLLAALRLLAVMAKKEAQRTGLAEDQRMHEQARIELELAEAANRLSAHVDLIDGDSARDVDAAEEAESRVAALTAKLGERTVPPLKTLE